MAVGTFTLCPEDIETRSRFASVSTTNETGHSRARAVVERPIRSWTLRWSLAEPGTVAEIRRQIEACSGGALTLNWTPPDEVSAVEVRLGSPGIRIDWANANAARVELDFDEVR